MIQMKEIAGAIQEVFRFLREWNNADQKQKRYALSRIRRIQKAADVAEQAFFVVDDMLAVIYRSGALNDKDAKDLQKLKARFKSLVDKFNRLD